MQNCHASRFTPLVSAAGTKKQPPPDFPAVVASAWSTFHFKLGVHHVILALAAVAARRFTAARHARPRLTALHELGHRLGRGLEIADRLLDGGGVTAAGGLLDLLHRRLDRAF